MNYKLIAMGNVLMKDDGIGIEIAKKIEVDLVEMGIEIIYGETDFQYCIEKIKERDYIFIIDAMFWGDSPGRVEIWKMEDFRSNKCQLTQHSYSFLDIIKLYYPEIKGMIFAVEVKEVGFQMGLSDILEEKLSDISNKILLRIEKALQENN